MAAEPGNKYAEVWTDEELSKLIEDLLDYAENAKSIHLAPWCRKHGFSQSWLHLTKKRHPILNEAVEKARELLSAKIVNSSFYGEGNAVVGMAYLPVYDDEFRELLKWKAEIQKELPQKEQNKCSFNEWKEQQK